MIVPLDDEDLDRQPLPTQREIESWSPSRRTRSASPASAAYYCVPNPAAAAERPYVLQDCQCRVR